MRIFIPQLITECTKSWFEYSTVKNLTKPLFSVHKLIVDYFVPNFAQSTISWGIILCEQYLSIKDADCKYLRNKKPISPGFQIWLKFIISQEVAVKRMTATKTKEFAAEMKVLCKVHHSNLVIPPHAVY